MHLLVYLVITANFIQVKCLNNIKCNLNATCEAAICEKFNGNECSKLEFYTNNEKNDFATEKLELVNNSLVISFDNIQWKNLNLKLSQVSEKSNNFCLKLSKPHRKLSLSCLEHKQETFELELQFFKEFDVLSKKIVFTTNPIFSYIEFSDTFHLLLKIQPLPEIYNVSTYKVEVWRDKYNQTTLQDLRLISADDRINGQISFDYYTYNEEGDYYFTVSVISEQCPEELCPKTTTHKIFIARKRPILVIGIVGASLILPFVLFLFHVLTKKYKNRDNIFGSKEQLLVIYQSTNEKNTILVNSLTKLLKQLLVIDVICDVITNKKLCEDLLLSSNYICCLHLPNSPMDLGPIKEIVPNKYLIEITFDLGQMQITDIKSGKMDRKFKLLDEFEEFLNEFHAFLEYSNYEDNPLFADLKLRIKEAKLEAEKIPLIFVSGTDDGAVPING